MDLLAYTDSPAAMGVIAVLGLMVILALAWEDVRDDR